MTLIDVALILFCLFIIAPAVQLVRGPSGIDRLLAFELLVPIVVGVISCLSLSGRLSFGVDLLILLLLVAFLGSIAFAWYLQRAKGDSAW